MRPRPVPVKSILEELLRRIQRFAHEISPRIFQSLRLSVSSRAEFCVHEHEDHFEHLFVRKLNIKKFLTILFFASFLFLSVSGVTMKVEIIMAVSLRAYIHISMSRNYSIKYASQTYSSRATCCPQGHFKPKNVFQFFP
jgi:hypothetical protein